MEAVGIRGTYLAWMVYAEMDAAPAGRDGLRSNRPLYICFVEWEDPGKNDRQRNANFDKLG